jgi:hypothetical protein
MIPDKIFEKARNLHEQVEFYPYQSGGILNSELLLFLAFAEINNCERIVESGRRNGYSTKFIDMNMLVGTKFVSVEISPIKEVDKNLSSRVELVTSDFNHYDAGDCSNTALLLDGPKGVPACRILKSLSPKVGAIHDMHKYHCDGSINKNRVEAEKMFPNAVFSDDAEWIHEYGILDESCLRGEYSSREEMTKCGFTLMVVEN